MTDTKEKILDTAERLIGERGYAATSLRHIIAQAGVNLAAVHYHFGSKEGLLDAVVERKAAPVNQARLAWLERVETEADVIRTLERSEIDLILADYSLPTFDGLSALAIVRERFREIPSRSATPRCSRRLPPLGRSKTH